MAGHFPVNSYMMTYNSSGLSLFWMELLRSDDNFLAKTP